MKLLIQPDDGIQPLVKAINKATRCIEIAIFRFDQREIERALANAVARGLSVHALIAHTNRAGEQNLRDLELRLLSGGVTVSRTADDLVRYHGKYMLIDRRELYLLGFNWTHLDAERSRSFGIITSSQSLVRDAARLFEADTKRFSYEATSGSLVVSPVNARKLLSAFIKGARKSLTIYDPKVSDPVMMALLAARAKAGVEIRILGRLTRKIEGVTARKLAPMRLHTRTIVRDESHAFLGSQSLRALELDARREVGVIFKDRAIVARLSQTFKEDWELAGHATGDESDAPAAKVARKVAKVLAKELPSVAPVVDGAVREIVGDDLEIELNPDEVEAAVKNAVREAVKEAVSDMVEEVVAEGQAGGK